MAEIILVSLIIIFLSNFLLPKKKEAYEAPAESERLSIY